MKIKLKEILTNNLILKISSLILALFLWIVVFWNVDPETEVRLQVPIEYKNEQLLEENNWYVSKKPSNIEIVVTCRSTKQKEITTNLFRAECDLSKRYGDDELLKSVRVDVTQVASNSSVESWSYSSQGTYVDITLEKIITRELDVELQTQGELPSTYQLNLDDVTLSTSKITLRGPSSALANVSQAAVTVDLSTLQEDVTQLELVPYFTDNNGRVITLDSTVTSDVEAVTLSLQILRTQNLSVTYEGLEGNLPDGYRYSEVTVSPDTVEVVGLKASLAGVQNITIPSAVLNIDGMTEDREFLIDITQYLPAGVTLYDESKNTITVTVKVEKLNNKVYRMPTSNIELLNTNANYSYRWSTETITVSLSGFSDDLNQYSSDEIFASLDVSGLEPGTYDNVKPTVDLPSGFILNSEPSGRLIVTDASDTTSSDAEESDAGGDESNSSENSSETNSTDSSAQESQEIPEQSGESVESGESATSTEDDNTNAAIEDSQN